MGQDYAQRKQAKKKWRKAAAKGAEELSLTDKATRRDRKKRKTRRLCQGMCYQEPALNAEDRKWNGKIEASDSDDEHTDAVDMEADAADRERRTSHAAATTSTPEADADAGSQPPGLSRRQAKALKLKQRQDKAKAEARAQKPAAPAGLVRLSTGVHLLDPELAQQQATDTARARSEARGQAGGLPAGDGPVMQAVALAPYAPLIRSFMMSQGFAEPTPIQEACWPLACAGGDVLGVAEPGSGKTLAYLLPTALRLKEAGHSSTTEPCVPAALVLAPTRELALQIASACRLLRKASGLRSVCLYGGVPKEQQVELLSKHPHIVVATPGRLLDLIDDGALRLTPSNTTSNATTADADATAAGPASTSTIQGNATGADPQGVQVVILDEADKMLSLGFETQLQRLHQMLLPTAPTPEPAAVAPVKKRKLGKAAAVAAESRDASAVATSSRPQVLLFSATMPEAVQEAAGQWLLPGAQRVVTTHSAASISKTVMQVVQVCAEHKKPAKLLRHLAAIKAKAATMRNVPRVLIFANRIKAVRFIHELVAKEGLRAVVLHGQRSQPEREEAMRDFRSGKAQVMVATDVAARGLDVRLLPYVVNYDFPGSLATYIHRVGRTGRLAAYGHAYSFFTRNLARLAEPVLELLQQHSQALDPNLVQLASTWQEAEAKLGPAGAAEAERRLAAMEAKAAGLGGEAEEEGEADDEGDDAAVGAVEDHEADARLEAEDLLEGLGGSGAAGGARTALKLTLQDRAKGKGKKTAGEGEGAVQEGRKGKRRAGEGEMDQEAAATNGAPSFAERLQKQKQVGKLAAQAQEAAGAGLQKQFVAAKAFAGARAGYAFKVGSQGLGYYLDRPPKKLGKATLHQITAKGKGPIVPIGPQHDKKRSGKSRFDSSSDEEEEKGIQGQTNGGVDGDEELQDDAPLGRAMAGGSGGGGRQAKKPLGGRLRKKLAKERAASKQ